MISAAMPSPMSNTITNSVLAAGHDGKDSRTSRTTGEMSKQNHGPLFFSSFDDRQRSRSLEELGPPDSPKGVVFESITNRHLAPGGRYRYRHPVSSGPSLQAPARA